MCSKILLTYHCEKYLLTYRIMQLDMNRFYGKIVRLLLITLVVFFLFYKFFEYQFPVEEPENVMKGPHTPATEKKNVGVTLKKDISKPRNVTKTQGPAKWEEWETSVKTNKGLTIVRVLSAGLPPLESVSQTSTNLNLTLQRELVTHQGDKESTFFPIHNFWVIQCMEDKTELERIRQILKSNDQKWSEITDCKESEKYEFLKRILDVNNARRFAISEAMHVFNNEWLFLMDGNGYVAKETIATLVESIFFKNEHIKVYLVPLYRVVHCQKKVDDEFKIEDMFRDRVVGYQESPQLLFNARFLNPGTLFANSEKQLNEDTLNQEIEAIKVAFPNEVMSFETRCPRQDSDSKKNCAYILRLLYRPDKDVCYENQENPASDSPVRNKHRRKYMKQQSIEMLQRRLGLQID